MKKIAIRKDDTKIEKKKKELQHIINSGNDKWFFLAVDPKIEDLLKQINENKTKLSDLNDKKKGTIEYIDSYGYECEVACTEDLEIAVLESELWVENDINEFQLLSIAFMKIIYLYMNFEMSLKKIISHSFESCNMRELYKWENFKSFSNSIDIDPSSIKKFNHINQLRIVNNNIKHSSMIEELTKKQDIKEFKNKDYFDFQSLHAFYLRIIDAPNAFLEDFANKIICNLYVYDQIRLQKIAKEYTNKMDKATGQKFVQILSDYFK
jgi:hypothetical protein